MTKTKPLPTKTIVCQCGTKFTAKKNGEYGWRPQYCKSCCDKKIWLNNALYRSYQ